MFGWRKRKVSKIVGGKMSHHLKLFTNGDFELECELEVPKDWWLAGVLKIEKRFRKKDLKRVDKLWDELPIDSKSLKLVQAKLLKEIVPSVLNVEVPLYQKQKRGKTFGFSSSSLKKIVILKKVDGSKHLAKISIGGIWYAE